MARKRFDFLPLGFLELLFLTMTTMTTMMMMIATAAINPPIIPAWFVSVDRQIVRINEWMNDKTNLLQFPCVGYGYEIFLKIKILSTQLNKVNILTLFRSSMSSRFYYWTR